MPEHNLALSGEWDVAAVPGLTLVSRIRARSKQEIDLTRLHQAPGVTTLGTGFYYRLRINTPVFIHGYVTT